MKRCATPRPIPRSAYPIEFGDPAKVIAHIKQTFDPRVAQAVVGLDQSVRGLQFLSRNADALGRILHAVYISPDWEIEADAGAAVLDDLLDAHDPAEIVLIASVACKVLQTMGAGLTDLMERVDFLAPSADGSDGRKSAQA